jgi:general secretion pathway protein I
VAESARRSPGSGSAAPCRSGFTLLEVMIAIAFIGIALIALLSLHHSNLQSVIRARDLTRAAMLAQALMSQAELERFPPPGQSHGDFAQLYPGEYRNFRWQREVEPSPLFPDIARVRVSVLYGPRLRRRFTLTEFMRNPAPPAGQTPASGASPTPPGAS